MIPLLTETDWSHIDNILGWGVLVFLLWLILR